MRISDNIIRKQLENVFFICGGAFGGKTTMARLIEEKHGLLRYRQGDHFDEYKSVAHHQYQPALCLGREKDWHGFFAQEPRKYADWMREELKEEAEFVVADLMRLPKDKGVIVDALIPVDILQRITDYEHVILLFAPDQMKREHYFDRADKDEVYQFILSFPDGEDLLKNVIAALNIDNQEERELFLTSGFRCIERTDDDTIERTLEAIEKHFGFESEKFCAKDECKYV